MKTLHIFYDFIFLVTCCSLTVAAKDHNNKRYWTYDKWRKALPRVDTITKKRSPDADQSTHVEQQYKEIKIDTSRLYKELLNAIDKQETVEQEAERRGKVSAPSIRDFDLSTTAKSSTKSQNNIISGQHRQYISPPVDIQSFAPTPAAVSNDPLSGRNAVEGSQTTITAFPHIPTPAIVAPPAAAPVAPPAAPVAPQAAPISAAYNVQSFDADVVPDGNGGMKILETKPVQNQDPILSSALTHQASIGHPNHESVINNPRNTQQLKEPKNKHESAERNANRRVYSLGDHVFTDIGCYLDKWIRAIPTLEGNHPLLMDSDYKSRSDPLQKCAEAALDKGLKVFALQNGGQCFGGANGINRYNVYGPSTSCRDDGLGGTWANEVYSYNSVPKPSASTGSVEKTSKGDTTDNIDDYDKRLLKEEAILSESEDKSENVDESPFKGQLKKIMKKVNEKKKTDAAAAKVVNALFKGIKVKGKSLSDDTSTSEKPTTSSVAESTTSSPFRLGRAIAHGHKPPCICPDKVCSSKLDLAFVIDAGAGSEQGGKDKMAETMEFGRRVASAFTVTPEESHVGLITYATDAQIMMNFNRFSDPDALTEARDAVRVKPHTGKYTGQALSLAKEGLFETGHRPDALDVLVLMTDGPASDDITEPARALRDMGVKIITVGIGPEVDKSQLNDMASDPDEEHVFTADYDSLATIIGRTQRAACVGGILRDPVAKCKCNAYNTNTDSNTEASLDKETAAFYSLYRSSIEGPAAPKVNVKYDTIFKPQDYEKPRTHSYIHQTSQRYVSEKRQYVPGDQTQMYSRKSQALPAEGISQAYYQNYPYNQNDTTGDDIGQRKSVVNGTLPLLNPHPEDEEDASPIVEMQRNKEETKDSENDKKPTTDSVSYHTMSQESTHDLEMLRKFSSSSKSDDDGKIATTTAERQRLVQNYLASHSPSYRHLHHINVGNDSDEHAREQLQHMVEKSFSSDTDARKSHHDLLEDEHFQSTSEGKVHPSDEEQVLGASKPLRQAGGSHNLPLEVMKETSIGGMGNAYLQNSKGSDQEQYQHSGHIESTFHRNTASNAKEDHQQTPSSETSGSKDGPSSEKSGSKDGPSIEKSGNKAASSTEKSDSKEVAPSTEISSNKSNKDKEYVSSQQKQSNEKGGKLTEERKDGKSSKENQENSFKSDGRKDEERNDGGSEKQKGYKTQEKEGKAKETQSLKPSRFTSQNKESKEEEDKENYADMKNNRRFSSKFKEFKSKFGSKYESPFSDNKPKKKPKSKKLYPEDTDSNVTIVKRPSNDGAKNLWKDVEKDEEERENQKQRLEEQRKEKATEGDAPVPERFSGQKDNSNQAGGDNAENPLSGSTGVTQPGSQSSSLQYQKFQKQEHEGKLPEQIGSAYGQFYQGEGQQQHQQSIEKVNDYKPLQDTKIVSFHTQHGMGEKSDNEHFGEQDSDRAKEQLVYSDKLKKLVVEKVEKEKEKNSYDSNPTGNDQEKKKFNKDEKEESKEDSKQREGKEDKGISNNMSGKENKNEKENKLSSSSTSSGHSKNTDETKHFAPESSKEDNRVSKIKVSDGTKGKTIDLNKDENKEKEFTSSYSKPTNNNNNPGNPGTDDKDLTSSSYSKQTKNHGNSKYDDEKDEQKENEREREWMKEKTRNKQTQKQSSLNKESKTESDSSDKDSSKESEKISKWSEEKGGSSNKMDGKNENDNTEKDSSGRKNNERYKEEEEKERGDGKATEKQQELHESSSNQKEESRYTTSSEEYQKEGANDHQSQQNVKQNELAAKEEQHRNNNKDQRKEETQNENDQKISNNAFQNKHSSYDPISGNDNPKFKNLEEAEQLSEKQEKVENYANSNGNSKYNENKKDSKESSESDDNRNKYSRKTGKERFSEEDSKEEKEYSSGSKGKEKERHTKETEHYSENEKEQRFSGGDSREDKQEYEYEVKERFSNKESKERERGNAESNRNKEKSRFSEDDREEKEEERRKGSDEMENERKYAKDDNNDRYSKEDERDQQKMEKEKEEERESRIQEEERKDEESKSKHFHRNSQKEDADNDAEESNKERPSHGDSGDSRRPSRHRERQDAIYEKEDDGKDKEKDDREKESRFSKEEQQEKKIKERYNEEESNLHSMHENRRLGEQKHFLHKEGDWKNVDIANLQFAKEDTEHEDDHGNNGRVSSNYHYQHQDQYLESPSELEPVRYHHSKHFSGENGEDEYNNQRYKERESSSLMEHHLNQHHQHHLHVDDDEDERENSAGIVASKRKEQNRMHHRNVYTEDDSPTTEIQGSEHHHFDEEARQGHYSRSADKENVNELSMFTNDHYERHPHSEKFDESDSISDIQLSDFSRQQHSRHKHPFDIGSNNEDEISYHSAATVYNDGGINSHAAKRHRYDGESDIDVPASEILYEKRTHNRMKATGLSMEQQRNSPSEFFVKEEPEKYVGRSRQRFNDYEEYGHHRSELPRFQHNQSYLTDEIDLKEGNVAKQHISRKDNGLINMRRGLEDVQATKKDDTGKGILVDDPYIDAKHFWPFDSSTAILTQDIMTGNKAILMNGAQIVKDDFFDNTASTHAKGSYIILGDFNGTCFADPEKCLLGGMSVSFWLKLSSLNDNQDQYVISSGSQSKKSRGIAFLFFHGEFVVCLSKKDKQWKIKIPKKQIPLNKWVNIAFVWRINDGSFTFYVNGERKQSTKGVSASRPDLKFTIMTAGRPNNAVNSEFMMPLCLSYLALWEAALTDKQVKRMYTNVKQKREDPSRRRKRNRLSKLKEKTIYSKDVIPRDLVL